MGVNGQKIENRLKHVCLSIEERSISYLRCIVELFDACEQVVIKLSKKSHKAG